MKSSDAHKAALRRLTSLEIVLTCSPLAGLGAEKRGNIAPGDLSGAEDAYDRIGAMVRDLKARHAPPRDLTTAASIASNIMALTAGHAQTWAMRGEFGQHLTAARIRPTVDAIQAVAAAGAQAIAAFVAGYGVDGPETKEMRQTVLGGIRDLINSMPERKTPGPKPMDARMLAALDRLLASGWRPVSHTDAYQSVLMEMGFKRGGPSRKTFDRHCGERVGELLDKL